MLDDGTIAAEGHGKYLKVPLNKIADFDVDAQEWRVIMTENDPESVEL